MKGVFVALLLALFLADIAFAKEVPEIPGVPCHQVAEFIAAVLEGKRAGATMQEQLNKLRKVDRKYVSQVRALEKLVRAIYTQPHLKNLEPDFAYSYFKFACDNDL